MREFIAVLEQAEVNCEVFTPPETVPDTNKTKIFLAGTIDMGSSEDWQTKIIGMFAKDRVMFLNPRRANWDTSWKQDIDSPKFRGQVEWELDQQDDADIIVMYFAPESKSPITLLELGLAVQYPEKVIVACPEGYWRRGNVEIVCERYKIDFVDSFEDMVDALRDRLN
jgi:hypothetical protein